MSPSSLLNRRRADDPIANHVHAFAAPRPRLSVLVERLDHLDIGDRAQRQRKAAALPRTGERLGLLGLELQCYGPADEGALAFLFLRRLVDRQNAHVGQDDLGLDDVRRALALQTLFALG